MASCSDPAPRVADALSPSTSVAIGSRTRWLVLALLSIIYVFNVADRLILSILAQDIKRDLNLSDWELGLLIGPAITFFYAVLGIPMAYVADRVNRVRFLALCLAAWSLLTALGGMASSALQLGLARIGVSAVEAGGSPSSSSIIADYFPPRQRPTAMGIYAAASMLGILISFGIGGIINAAVGWRWTLVAAGAPGMILAIILIVLVHEPRRGAHDDLVKGDAKEGHVPVKRPHILFAFATLWSCDVYRRIILTAGISSFSFQAIVNWGPSLIMRKFYAGTGQAGLTLGLGIATCGGAASVIGGYIISRLSRNGLARPLRIAAGLQLFSVPLLLAALFANRLEFCVALMCVAYGLQSFFVPIYWSASQSHVPPDMRAMASALLLLMVAVIGYGVGTPLIGAISDWLQPYAGNASLEIAMLLAVFISFVTAGLLWSTGKAAAREGL